MLVANPLEGSLTTGGCAVPLPLTPWLVKETELLKTLSRFASVLALASLAVAPGAALFAQTAPAYHEIARISISGEGGWDYLSVDSAAHRLYVTHSTEVVVIDTERNAVVGKLAGTSGVHGVAIAPKLHRGFTSNGRDNSVTIFDTRTLKEIQRVSVGKSPDAILFDPVSDDVFTFNGGSNDSTVLKAATGKVVKTIPLGGRPEFAVTDGKGMVFDNIEDTSELVAIDVKALEVKHRWPLAPGDGPSGLAIDPKQNRAFAVCGNKMMAVVDTTTGKLLGTPEIGSGPDAAGFDPTSGIAVSSNGQDGTMTLVHVGADGKPAVLGSVATQRGARTMTLDPRTHRIYLIAAKYGELPAAAAGGGRRRPPIVPGSTVVLVYGL